uniref:Ovule protein n=1 Tax=Globodera pallida TaxID=36090 RepID=A0A183BLE8_GLOPA
MDNADKSHKSGKSVEKKNQSKKEHSEKASHTATTSQQASSSNNDDQDDYYLWKLATHGTPRQLLDFHYNRNQDNRGKN